MQPERDESRPKLAHWYPEGELPGARRFGTSSQFERMQQAAFTQQLERLTGELEVAQGRIDELCRQDEPSLRISIHERIKAFESARGKSWISAATNLLTHRCGGKH